MNFMDSMVYMDYKDFMDYMVYMDYMTYMVQNLLKSKPWVFKTCYQLYKTLSLVSDEYFISRYHQ